MQNCFFILFSILLFSCVEKGASPNLTTANILIDEVKGEYVPDRRTAHFVPELAEDNGLLILRGETTIPEAKADLVKKLKAAEITFTDGMMVLPSPILAGKNYGVVNVSVCNIRSAGKHSAELGTQALLGTPLRVWKKAGSWYFIQTPDNYFGWVDDGGLTPMTKTEFEKWMNWEKAVVTKDFDFLLENPSPNSLRVSDLTAGGILQLVENQGTYAQLSFPDGRTGYLPKGHFLPYPEWMKTRQPTAENILASAKEFLGRPYLWGGTSGKGVDCSGFTKTVYYLNGIQLERDASLQVHTGKLVETDTSTWANLLPGDLMFFGRPATADKKEKVTHVAIYMGDGKIIHASDRVKIESLRRGDPTFVPYRVTSFIKAKRMLGSEGQNGVVALRDSPWYGSESKNQ